MLNFIHSKFSKKRQEELRKSLRLIHKNKRIKESFEGQEYFGKIDPEHIENVVDKLEEKLKEYIIDENEIEAIGRC